MSEAQGIILLLVVSSMVPTIGMSIAWHVAWLRGREIKRLRALVK